MPLPSLTLPNAFTLVASFHNNVQPTNAWRSTIDIHATVQPVDGDPIIEALKSWWRANLRTDASLFQLALRNWSQGPVPFSQRGHLWESVYADALYPGQKTAALPAGYGAEGIGNQHIGGEVCVLGKRTNSGAIKAANMFVRGLLDDVDTAAATGGGYAIVAGANVTAVKFNAISANFLINYLGAGRDPGLINVHTGNHHAGPAFSTPMINILFDRPTTSKQGRKSRR